MVESGETITFNIALNKRADYGILCYRVPRYAVYGDGFTLEG
jgi:hypothetical protein